MRKPLLDQTLEEVAAANDYVRSKEERAVAAGRSVYFMDAGRFYERNAEGIFEIVQAADGHWARMHELARRINAAERVVRSDERNNDDGQRFPTAVKRADGRRLTWKALTDKSEP